MITIVDLGSLGIFIVDWQKDFTPPSEDLEKLWNKVEKDERFEKIQPLVMSCVVSSERFSEYVYVEPKLLPWNPTQP